MSTTMRFRKFKHTSMYGNRFEVTWTPEGLEVTLNDVLQRPEADGNVTAVEHVGAREAAKETP